MVPPRVDAIRFALLLAGGLALGAVPAAGQSTVAGARARLAAGDRVGSLALLDRLIESDSLDAPARTEALLLRTTLEEDGARYEERLRDLLGRGLRQDRQAWVHLSLGQIAYLRGEFSLALREFQRAREEGREEEGSLWEGLCAFALGDAEAARGPLLRAQASGNRAIRHRALLALGQIEERAENWSEARRHYRAIREDGPGGTGWWPTATLREAECLDRLENTEEGVTLRKELLSACPDAYEAPLALARLEAAPMAPPEPEEEVPAGKKAETFAVQVGAFADPGHADALLQVLTSRGIPNARIVEGENGLRRVLVGSGLDRAHAESLGDSLGAVLGVGFSLFPESRR